MSREHAFQLMDEYSGPEADRVSYLAGQFTCFGDDLSDAEISTNLSEAEAIVLNWRLQNMAREHVEGRVGSVTISYQHEVAA